MGSLSETLSSWQWEFKILISQSILADEEVRQGLKEWVSQSKDARGDHS